MDKKLLSILICPKTLKSLKLHPTGNALICIDEDIAYPIIDGIPHLTLEAAKPTLQIPGCRESSQNDANN
jgi:hypothetical protein